MLGDVGRHGCESLSDEPGAWRPTPRGSCYSGLHMDKNTEDILDALDFIKERMATKADVAELRRSPLS